MRHRLAYSLMMVVFLLASLPLLFPGRLRAWQAPVGFSQDSHETTVKRKVVKTDAEWRRILTRAQYEVTRQKATEPPFSGKYATSHAPGIFVCVACGADLFSSKAKFDSGTGWPSFWQPVDPKRIETAGDYHLAEPRVEVICRDCGAHLGHVFEDGPAPTGLRYCINSVSLKLVPPTDSRPEGTEKATPGGSTPSKAKGKSKSKLKSKAETRKSDPSNSESDLPSSTPESPKEKTDTPPPVPEAV